MRASWNHVLRQCSSMSTAARAVGSAMPRPHRLAVLFQFFCMLALGRTSYFKNFSFPEGYVSQTPPTGIGNQPFPIQLKAEIIHILKVREFDFKTEACRVKTRGDILDAEKQGTTFDQQVLSLDLVVRRMWTESRLVVPGRLKKGRMYLIDKQRAAEFWKPQVHIRNLLAYNQAHDNEDISYLVLLEGNRMMMIDRAYTDIRCGFDFQLFPLDTQTCMIEFVLPMAKVEEETLDWTDKKSGAMLYRRPGGEEFRLPKFKVQLVICEHNFTSFHLAGNVSALRFWVILQRELSNYLLETYIPTGIFVIVSWGSFLINPEVVPGRMVLLVTNLLSLITLFESTRSSSPPCVGVKSMDVWILGCISFVVMALMEYCVILYLLKEQTDTQTDSKLFTNSTAMKSRNENNSRFKELPNDVRKRKLHSLLRRCVDAISNKCLKKRKGSWFFLDRMSLVIFPVAFLVFSSVYWIIVNVKLISASKIYCP